MPTQGLLYRFAKLYANQSEEDARFSMRYVHRSAGFAGLWISLLASLAIWAGIVLVGPKPVVAGQNLPRYLPWVLLITGSLGVTASINLLGSSVVPPSILSLVIAVALAAWRGLAWWQKTTEHE